MQPMPTDPAGRLFARGLDQIDELYIEPVSNRRLALDATARLVKLDPKLHVAETPGPAHGTEIVVNDGEREIADYPSPVTDDPHVWGGWLGALIAAAKQASPIIAAGSQDDVDKAMFDGMTGGLDRFSRYATPQVARDQRAARDGFGGVGMHARNRRRPVPHHHDHPRQPGRPRRNQGRRPDRRGRRGARRQPLAKRRDPAIARPDRKRGRGQRHPSGEHRRAASYQLQRG